MRVARRIVLVLVPIVALGACTTLSEQDRALLTSASQNAQAAKAAAQQALDAARAAQASAAQVAADAQAANEQTDRLLQRSPPK